MCILLSNPKVRLMTNPYFSVHGTRHSVFSKRRGFSRLDTKTQHRRNSIFGCRMAKNRVYSSYRSKDKICSMTRIKLGR